MFSLYSKRCQQFQQWADNFENRLNDSQDGDVIDPSTKMFNVNL